MDTVYVPAVEQITGGLDFAHRSKEASRRKSILAQRCQQSLSECQAVAQDNEERSARGARLARAGLLRAARGELDRDWVLRERSAYDAPRGATPQRRRLPGDQSHSETSPKPARDMDLPVGVTAPCPVTPAASSTAELSTRTWTSMSHHEQAATGGAGTPVSTSDLFSGTPAGAPPSACTQRFSQSLGRTGAANVRAVPAPVPMPWSVVGRPCMTSRNQATRPARSVSPMPCSSRTSRPTAAPIARMQQQRQSVSAAVGPRCASPLAKRSVSPMPVPAVRTSAAWVTSTPAPPVASTFLSPAKSNTSGTMSPTVPRGNVRRSVAPMLLPCWQAAAVPPGGAGSVATSSVGGRRAPSEPAGCSARPSARSLHGARQSPGPELIALSPRSCSPMPCFQSTAVLPPVPAQWQHRAQARADLEAPLPDPDASRCDLEVSPAASDIQVDVAMYVSGALRGQAVRQLLSCLRVAAHRRVSCALGRWWRATATTELGGTTAAGALAKLATPDKAWHHRNQLHSVLASAVAAEGRKVAQHERTLSMLLGLQQLHSCLHMWDHVVLRAALRQLRNHTLDAASQCGASGAPASSSTDPPTPAALLQALHPAPQLLPQPVTQTHSYRSPPQHADYFEGLLSSASGLGYSPHVGNCTGGVAMPQVAAEGGAASTQPPSRCGPTDSSMRHSLPPTCSRASLVRLSERSSDKQSLARRASMPWAAPSRQQEQSDTSASSTARLVSATVALQGTEALAFGGPGALSETTSSWDSAQTIANVGMKLAKPPLADLAALSEDAPSGLSMKIAAASPTTAAAAAAAAATAGAEPSQSASSAQAPYGIALDSALELTPPVSLGTTPGMSLMSTAPLLHCASGQENLEADVNLTGADQHDESETFQVALSTEALGSVSQRLNVSLRQIPQRSDQT